MKFTRWVVVLLLAQGLTVSAADVAGRWKATVTGGTVHKTIAEATFDFKTNGNRLTGTANIGTPGYPGMAPIADGRIDGDQISFTVVGRHPSSNGLPIMKFTGTVSGDQLSLSMNLTDGHVGAGTTEMKGLRVRVEGSSSK